MKFGKEFRTHLEETIPEWRDKFLCYKPLKKLLKRFPNNPISLTTQNQHQTQNQNGQSLENNGDPTVDVGRDGPSAGGNGTASGPSERFMSLDEFQDWFVRLLNDELDKLKDFYVEKEEDYVIRFQVFTLSSTPSKLYFVYLFLCDCDSGLLLMNDFN